MLFTAALFLATAFCASAQTHQEQDNDAMYAPAGVPYTKKAHAGPSYYKVRAQQDSLYQAAYQKLPKAQQQELAFLRKRMNTAWTSFGVSTAISAGLWILGSSNLLESAQSGSTLKEGDVETSRVLFVAAGAVGVGATISLVVAIIRNAEHNAVKRVYFNNAGLGYRF